MSKRRTVPTEKELPAEPGPGDICLLEDRFRQDQLTLDLLNKRLFQLVLKEGVPEDQEVAITLGIDIDLLDRVKEIVRSVGREIVEWSKLTISDLSMLIEKIRAAIGRRQIQFA